MVDEIARQIIVEMYELNWQIEECRNQGKPRFISTMYRQLLQKKQDELKLLSENS